MEHIAVSGPLGWPGCTRCLPGSLGSGACAPRPRPPPELASLTGFSLPCVRSELEGASLG